VSNERGHIWWVLQQFSGLYKALLMSSGALVRMCSCATLLRHSNMLQHAATCCNTLLQHTATLMLRDATEASIAYTRMNMSSYACTCVLPHMSTSHHTHKNDSSTAHNAHVTKDVVCFFSPRPSFVVFPCLSFCINYLRLRGSKRGTEASQHTKHIAKRCNTLRQVEEDSN